MQNTTTTRRPLSAHENSLLDSVQSGSWGLRAISPEASRWWPVEEAATPQQRAAEWTAARLDDPAVVIVWEDSLDGISFGVVRTAFRFEGFEEEFEASPFPGGWTRVPRSKILAVRSAQAM